MFCFPRRTGCCYNPRPVNDCPPGISPSYQQRPTHHTGGELVSVAGRTQGIPCLLEPNLTLVARGNRRLLVFAPSCHIFFFQNTLAANGFTPLPSCLCARTVLASRGRRPPRSTQPSFPGVKVRAVLPSTYHGRSSRSASVHDIFNAIGGFNSADASFRVHSTYRAWF